MAIGVDFSDDQVMIILSVRLVTATVFLKQVKLCTEKYILYVNRVKKSPPTFLTISNIVRKVPFTQVFILQ